MEPLPTAVARPNPPVHEAGRAWPVILVTVLIALVVALIPVWLATRDDDAPPDVASGLSVEVGEVQIVPDVAGEQRHAIAREVSAMLDELYTQAFGPRSKRATPVASGATRIDDLEAFFTPAAYQGLSEQDDVFHAGDNLHLTSGKLNWNGVVTVDGPTVVDAVLHVDLKGNLARTGSGDTTAQVHQVGTVELVRKGGVSWVVRGIDLRIATYPERS